MFVQLSSPGGVLNAVTANGLLQLTPFELAWLIERVWGSQQLRPVATLQPFPVHYLFEQDGVPPGAPSPWQREMENLICNFERPFVTPHLIYAYLIENTRVYEIVAKLLEHLVHGEKMGIPVYDPLTGQNAQSWLRATEELFFSDGPHGLVHRTTSSLRPDSGATRRNAYFRMFGLDLNHKLTAGSAYPNNRPERSNTTFVETFEQLLKEVWVGIANSSNTSGRNDTDQPKIQLLVDQLRDMLRERRAFGNLIREEFSAVVTLSWCHLSVMYASPILNSLAINATTPQEFLTKLGNRVGVPAHPRTENFFQLALPMSEILLGIENGVFNNGASVNLYAAAVAPAVNVARTNMETIITHWSIATGRNLKARDVNQMPAGAMAR